MKTSGGIRPTTLLVVATLTCTLSAVSAFHPHSPFSTSTSASPKRPTTLYKYSAINTNINTKNPYAVDIGKNAPPRDVATMEEWAASYGVQRAEGVQIVQEFTSDDNEDYGLMTTTQDLPVNTPVLFVPQPMILSSFAAREEFGFVDGAETILQKVKATDHLPQFYLFLKILKEYENSNASPWYPWLNSLPKQFYNGASMTQFCFDSLPPLVGFLSLKERIKFTQFYHSLKYVNFLTKQTTTNKDLARWAFSVVFTRGFPTPDGDFRIAPMADMFNHGSTETEISLNYDEEGNCYAYTTYDVPAGSPLRMSYGDPTNPSHLFARYGFVDESSPATFCKIMIDNPSQQLIDLGYDPSRMLFYKDTGDVSPEVWDVLLYQILEGESSDDQQAFYNAHVNGDYETKQAIHEQYYSQKTLVALKNHVDTFLNQLDKLVDGAANRDLTVHPRLPMILKHNAFVKETFLAVQAKLYNSQ